MKTESLSCPLRPINSHGQYDIMRYVTAGSPWRDLISNTILKLQESGKIPELYDRWWKQPGICDKILKTDSKANSLGISNVRQ